MGRVREPQCSDWTWQFIRHAWSRFVCFLSSRVCSGPQHPRKSRLRGNSNHLPAGHLVQSQNRACFLIQQCSNANGSVVLTLTDRGWLNLLSSVHLLKETIARNLSWPLGRPLVYVCGRSLFTSSDSPCTCLPSMQARLFRRIHFGIPRPMR